MATHFICQSTEPLPHVYPTGLPQQSHGAVSQYELYNKSNKPHTQFPPPGWDFSQTSEEDSLPLLQPVPQTIWKNSSFQPDPDLCITPQKIKVSNSRAFTGYSKKPVVDPDPLLALTPEKFYRDDLKKDNSNNNAALDKGKKQRVRFDIEENSDKLSNESTTLTQNLNSGSSIKTMQDKPYQPELYGENDKEDDIGDLKKLQENTGSSRTVKYTFGKVSNQPVYKPLQGEEYSINEHGVKQMQSTHFQSQTVPSKTAENALPRSKGANIVPVKVVREKTQAGEKVSALQDADPIAACRVSQANVPKRKVKVLRENQYHPKQTEYTFPFTQNALESGGGEEHMFARPEYNSTLRMKLEAEKLKASTIDIEYALQKKLKVSEATTSEINEKASSLVNTGRSAYSGLVSLALPAEDICKQAAELTTARAKQVKVPKSKSKDHREPDLMEFFTNDRQKESVTYTLPGISSPSEKLSTASHWRAFDLYKHNRVWEGRGSKK